MFKTLLFLKRRHSRL